MIHRVRLVGGGVGVEFANGHTENGLFDIWHRSLLDMT